MVDFQTADKYKPETEKKGRQPDFKNNEGLAIWINKDKNGEDYLSVVLLGTIRLAAFKNKPK